MWCWYMIDEEVILDKILVIDIIDYGEIISELKEEIYV